MAQLHCLIKRRGFLACSQNEYEEQDGAEKAHVTSAVWNNP